MPASENAIAASSAGEEGAVRLNVLVEEKGRPKEVLVAQSSGFPHLDEAARQGLAVEVRSRGQRTQRDPGVDPGRRRLQTDSRLLMP
jgi:TonB family protein